MRSALLLSTAFGFVALLASPRVTLAPDLSAVVPAKTERVAPPGLIRGVMTDDLKSLAYVNASRVPWNSFSDVVMLEFKPGPRDRFGRLGGGPGCCFHAAACEQSS